MTGIKINNITFGYSSPVFEQLNLSLSEGWTALVGRNGCGKTTLIRLILGELEPWSGSVTVHGETAYCSQSTENPPPAAESFLYDYSGRSLKLKGILGISEDWPDRWRTLSHGERIRFQIGCALNIEPDIFLADEPTNHLDSLSRGMVLDALGSFRGTGILVSHDRLLLNSLPQQCLFINPPSAVLRPGSYEAGRTEEIREKNEMVHKRDQLRKRIGKLKTEAARKKQSAAKAYSDRSKRHLDLKDHDGRAAKDLARLTGRDAVQSRQYRKLQNRVDREIKKIGEMDVQKETELKIYTSTGTLKSDFIFRTDAGSIAMGEKTLFFPELNISPGDRIGITGQNGCGKSTLVNYITCRLSTDRCLYIPQEVPEETASEFLSQINRMARDEKARIYASIYRLGSDPERIYETDIPSPGELRKLMLAEGFLHSPAVLIMDEPTNHMDIDSIECLERSLAEADCALVIVSHDRDFIADVADINWVIDEEMQESVYRLSLQ